MDPEQTNTLPLFLRRVGNGEKSSASTMKNLVFPGEESDGGAKTVCPEIKVHDLSCSHTVSDMVLLSPSRKYQGFTSMKIGGKDEIHGRSSGSRLLKESRSERKASGMTVPLSYSQFSQEDNDARNSSEPREKTLPINNTESVSSTISFDCIKLMSIPLDEKEQRKADDGRTRIPTRMSSSPMYLPRPTEKIPSSFLKVFHREISPGSTSDSDSSANSSPSGFFKTRFRFHSGSGSSACGSFSGSSTSTTPGISPSGDFRELTWYDDPSFRVNRRNQEFKSTTPYAPTAMGSTIENELHRCSLAEVLTPIEIEAQQRYERRIKRKKERDCKKEETFFF